MDEYKRRRRRSRAVMSMFLGSSGGSIDDVDIATFDSDGGDLQALIVGIELTQSGTGDPSPDNVRPISGHSSVNVIVSPTLNPLDGTITNIPLGTTVYGGTLDVVTGVLTVTKAKIAFHPSDVSTWFDADASRTTLGFYRMASDFSAQYPVPKDDSSVIFEQYKRAPAYNNNNPYVAQLTFVSDVFNKFEARVPKDVLGSFSTYAQSKAAVNAYLANNPIVMCYNLATPQTIQLTGQRITTFIGTNNVWCDSGKIIHLEY